jgi:predicted nucleic acid-binding protein
VLSIVAVSGPRFDAAAEILRTRGLEYNIRTLDVLHLATAQAVDRRARLTSFVVADKKLSANAVACGLNVEDLG